MTDVARPGSKFHAPQARLVDVRTGQVLRDANDNLVNLRLTQVHHGVSQVSITLNNQKSFPTNPRFPPWQYNDLQTFKFGQRLRLDMRYGTDAQWTAMILARITDLQFSFPSTGGATLVVQGEDLLSLLKIQDPQKQDKPYKAMKEADIIANCVHRAGADADLPKGQALGNPLTFSQPLQAETHQKSQSFLQFMQMLAERIDYELFVDFDSYEVPENPQPNQPAVKLHFEPARSLTLNSVVELNWGSNLIELNPRFKVWDQYTSVTAKGRDPRRRQPVDKTAEEPAVLEDLKFEGAPKPKSAVALRRRFFADEQPDNPFSVSVTNLDVDRALAHAKRLLRESARAFLTAEGSTIGFPKIRPGIHLRIGGLRAPFDGMYYVTQAVHTLDDRGYRTNFSVRRPGMLPPEGYQAGTP